MVVLVDLSDGQPECRLGMKTIMSPDSCHLQTILLCRGTLCVAVVLPKGGHLGTSDSRATPASPLEMPSDLHGKTQVIGPYYFLLSGNLFLANYMLRRIRYIYQFQRSGRFQSLSTVCRMIRAEIVELFGQAGFVDYLNRNFAGIMDEEIAKSFSFIVGSTIVKPSGVLKERKVGTVKSNLDISFSVVGIIGDDVAVDAISYLKFIDWSFFSFVKAKRVVVEVMIHGCSLSVYCGGPIEVFRYSPLAVDGEILIEQHHSFILAEIFCFQHGIVVPRHGVSLFVSSDIRRLHNIGDADLGRLINFLDYSDSVDDMLTARTEFYDGCIVKASGYLHIGRYIFDFLPNRA